MKITIEAEPKEIADLVSLLQNRQTQKKVSQVVEQAIRDTCAKHQE